MPYFLPCRRLFKLTQSVMMIVRICVIYLIITTKSEVWPFYLCLGLDRETMICVVCLFILFWNAMTATAFGWWDARTWCQLLYFIYYQHQYMCVAFGLINTINANLQYIFTLYWYAFACLFIFKCHACKLLFSWCHIHIEVYNLRLNLRVCSHFQSMV